MRTIDADALIAHINECIDVQNDNWEFERAIGLTVALECISDAPTIEPEQQWISASERLPELGQLVLVASAIDGDIHLCTQCATEGQMFIMDGTRYHVLGKAWMSCPGAYRGEET